MLPSILAKQLEQGIEDYVESSFPMSNGPFKGSLRKMIDSKDDALCHDPYMAVKLPFRTADSIPERFEALHPDHPPYVHQAKAFHRIAEENQSTIIATGTGSGKTECFLYPILEYCAAHAGEPGIKAIIIYPMNALATDQAKRLAEMIWDRKELRGNITAGMYVGGHEDHPSASMTRTSIITDHDAMLGNPPDILLTNYKMLDYLLVRPKDAALWKVNASRPNILKYIVADELHTYDGAQGTDLACLLRRVKNRVWTTPGGLCCIGTSATLGSADNTAEIRSYASDVFGEDFDEECVITEDRLTPKEFFAGRDGTNSTVPTAEQTAELASLIAAGSEDAFLRAAAAAWLRMEDTDVMTPEGRVALGELLMDHGPTQSLIAAFRNGYQKTTDLGQLLSSKHPELDATGDPDTAINALLALVSHARVLSAGNLRPFLEVKAQLWIKEQRRLLGRVDANEVSYALERELNSQERAHYLPVATCRDCGNTAWASIDNQRGSVSSARLGNLDTFYNLFFAGDERVIFMYPRDGEECPDGMAPAKLCPTCMRIHTGRNDADTCDNCGEDELIDIALSRPLKEHGSRDLSRCPVCGSHHGMILAGVRNTTQISTELSQLFASGFNDDKKTLAFSDSVQDAAHRAGFLTARTWKTTLRRAIQRYLQDAEGANGHAQSMTEFTDGFLQYWHDKLSTEDFIGYFIAPNMMWRAAYEKLTETGKIGSDDAARHLVVDIDRRLSYEIMLEYGLMAKRGRTLQNTGSSCLAFPVEAVKESARRVAERVQNELGAARSVTEQQFEQLVLGYLRMMADSGAFHDKAFSRFLSSGGSTFMLSNTADSWRPGLDGVNTPRFLLVANTGRAPKYRGSFDTVGDRKYREWISACVDCTVPDAKMLAEISSIVAQELERSRLVDAVKPEGTDFVVYALNKDSVVITDDVVRMRCDVCGMPRTVPAAESAIWEEAPCPRYDCDSCLIPDTDIGAAYFKRMYTTGDLTRLNAREHTSLLDNADRTELETQFKGESADARPWNPNVLSCTPTLEMGIDIGDLSTVVLCSIPPTQAQFLQRAGRAGRKDGNALTLAVAAARPHDLYFYADPLDMLEDGVTPPRVFLNASAVLERQFMAYCMDCWVRDVAEQHDIPRYLANVLQGLDTADPGTFPFNFLSYVHANRATLLATFLKMFGSEMGPGVRKDLERFATGKALSDSPMYERVLNAFRETYQHRSALTENVKKLNDMVLMLHKKPKDSSYEAEKRELLVERTALANVIKAVNTKNVFSFLSEEGLLPNYAFPEPGVVLKAVVYRKKEEEVQTAPGVSDFSRATYEYSRPAASAIREFAPGNTFYAGGRQLPIDQVDLVTAQPEDWRLCPNCSHAERIQPDTSKSSCPRCGSTGWADVGQRRKMLRVQMVYANVDQKASLIADDSDDRTNRSYVRQQFVDVDSEKDIHSAYEMDNNEFAFGYDFVRSATVREINFGEKDISGEQVRVGGVDGVRKGFRICRHCGKIQPAEDDKHAKPAHTKFCRAVQGGQVKSKDTYEECLFLYRELTTEALRILIPATTMDSTKVRTESFVAAFMLGMQERFGNVDHLRAVVTEVPIEGTNYRKQYLVVYDSVPGGTGYLEELMKDEGSLVDVLERARTKLQNCTCAEDPQKDGCYRCLLAHRQSYSIGDISRSAALRLLDTILSGKDSLHEIKSVDNVPVNPLVDSELEQRFLEALPSSGNAQRKVTLEKEFVNGKEGYRLQVGDSLWEVEPQVKLDASDGVAVTSRPDFVLRPLKDGDARQPVAVFLDGYEFHDRIVADDTLKREAIRRSGRYRVWTLSWKDVESAFETQDPYATFTLDPGMLPGTREADYQKCAREFKAEAQKPGELTTFELLMQYLEKENAEDLFAGQARAYMMCMPDKLAQKEDTAFMEWKNAVRAVNDEVQFMGDTSCTNVLLFGTMRPGKAGGHITIRSCCMRDENKTALASACAVLDDSDIDAPNFQADWNGFWHLFNLLQFSPNYVAVTTGGLADHRYALLPGLPTQESAWAEACRLLFDDAALIRAGELEDKGVPAPDEIGYELTDDTGAIVAELELAWPDSKIALMTADQLPDRAAAQSKGWRIFTADDDLGAVVSMWGNNE